MVIDTLTKMTDISELDRSVHTQMGHSGPQHPVSPPVLELFAWLASPSPTLLESESQQEEQSSQPGDGCGRTTTIRVWKVDQGLLAQWFSIGGGNDHQKTQIFVLQATVAKLQL